MSGNPRYVIAGGSGLIGTRLAARWAAEGADVVVLSRSERPRSESPGVRAVRWDGRELGPWGEEIDGAAAVVNLSGENVAEGRWTEARKRRLRTSRIEPTRALIEAIGRAGRRPSVFVQASAVGYYGDRGDERLDETSPPGRGFLPDLCREWERASVGAEALGVRRVLLRTGIALAREGGALAKMLPAFRLAVGGPLGDGRQWFPWIHLDDAVEAIRFLAAREDLGGPFLLVAPEPVRNEAFTRVLANACRRPAPLRVPAVALRLLFGELAQVLLGGQRTEPRRLLEAGFRFAHREVEGALADLLGRLR